MQQAPPEQRDLGQLALQDDRGPRHQQVGCERFPRGLVLEGVEGGALGAGGAARTSYSSPTIVASRNCTPRIQKREWASHESRRKREPRQRPRQHDRGPRPQAEVEQDRAGDGRPRASAPRVRPDPMTRHTLWVSGTSASRCWQAPVGVRVRLQSAVVRVTAVISNAATTGARPTSPQSSGGTCSSMPSASCMRRLL